MTIDLLQAKLYSNISNHRSNAEGQLRSLRTVERFVILLDLFSSTNHRFFRGAEDAYVRAEVFFGLARDVFGYTASITVAKELGDGILAIAVDGSEALEACLVIKRMERFIRNEYADELFPFRIHTGIGFGKLKQLNRPAEDFLGEAIDELAKILGQSDKGDCIIVSRPCYEMLKENIDKFPFLNVGPMEWWRDKGERTIVHDPIDYYCVEVSFEDDAQWNSFVYF